MERGRAVRLSPTNTTRRAVWRRPPDEPQRGLGLVRVVAFEALSLPSVNQPLMIVTMLFWAFAFFGAVFSGALACVLAVMALMIAFVRSVGRFERRLSQRSRAKWEGLFPAPCPVGTFPVRVVVRYRGALTGLDIAVASFVDGWLHVEGHRMSFAVRAGEGRAEWRGDRLRIGFLDGQGVSISLADFRDGAGRFFPHTARLWVADREHPEGDSILPPLGVYPTVRTALRAGMLASGLTALVLYVLACRLGDNLWSLPLALLGGSAVLLFARSVRACIHQNDADNRTPERRRPVR